MHVVQTTVADKIDSMMPLLERHWDEIARNKDVMVLKPNVQAYAALESAGLLIGLIAYDGEQPIGYAVTVLNHSHLHYADLATAMNDVLFVLPEYRGASRAGLRLIAETERIAKERGAQLVMWHAKRDTALEGLLPRLGYEVQDVIYSRAV
jgi:GNAT superfamily N-acetyltransferase